LHLFGDLQILQKCIDNLKAGLYQVKVKTDNTDDDAPNPVHNLFEVADLKDV
jgi:hypothetical protein